MSTFLHGVLYVTVHRAQDLPDVDTAFFNIGKDYSDPFVVGQLGEVTILKTSVINNNLNPVWNEKFRVDVCNRGDSVVLKVRDKDHISYGELGIVTVRTEDLLTEEEVDGWFDLITSNGDVSGQLNISIQFISKTSLEASGEVPDCYFEPRENNRMTLYQDAHCPQLSMFEGVTEPDGSPFEAPCAWKDLYEAIQNAEKFVYFTGWSVYTAISLLRGEDDDRTTVGELIQQKADQGLHVLGLVWNEKLSTEVTPGLMGTHDEETRMFFDGTGVDLVLVPRQKETINVLENQFVSTCYTHHQKSIIVDAPGGSDDRKRIIAFVGGLDITDGRWDTPEHPLFRTLNNEHQGDFYNGCATTTPEVGPRQPWHDIHSRVEGRAAYDVLQNFVERWRKQAPDLDSRIYTITDDEFDIETVPDLEEDQAWNVQLFRTICSSSAVFDLDRIHTLYSRKGRLIEKSIQRAYVHQIRRAQRYIFIENQYFLGSAHNWDDEKQTRAYHLIPVELISRIIEKIAAGERFAVYIIIPMYPEGDPTSGAVQEILHWQTNTIQMMYKAIAAAIEEHGVDAHPTDYLNFYCLGKRESEEEIPEDLPPPDPDTPAEVLRNTRRFMIYVHSKMMIIDDEYVIIGSANINQRSLGGSRDTEIAVGAYQPNHCLDAGVEPRGSVYTFRQALWAEHLGITEEVFEDPSSLECVQRVNELAQENWETYAGEDSGPTTGHLLKYPVTVADDGSVTTIEGGECFPDTAANVVGENSFFLPNKLTT